MVSSSVKNFQYRFPDDESCLEWLKIKFYPNGIICPICKKVTKHHKVSKRRCYACDNCGNHIFPTAGTLFHKSPIPLRIWFELIFKISNAKKSISAKEVQCQYGMTYKTARRMLQKIRGFLLESPSFFAEVKIGKTYHKDYRAVNAPAFRIPPSRPIKNIFLKKTRKNHLGKHYLKSDRTARLLKLQMILHSSEGLEIEEIAQRCSISKRTVYRDLQALESELGIPIWERGSRRGILEGYQLPPIPFTIDEAQHIFIAVYFLQKYSPWYDPNIASTFTKLSSVVPPILEKYIQSVLKLIENKPKNNRLLDISVKISRACLSQHRVTIWYKGSVDKKPLARLIDPYLTIPTGGRSSRIIAYCHMKKAVTSFITNNIEDIRVEHDTYIIPSDFDPIHYLSLE